MMIMMLFGDYAHILSKCCWGLWQEHQQCSKIDKITTVHLQCLVWCDRLPKSSDCTSMIRYNEHVCIFNIRYNVYAMCNVLTIMVIVWMLMTTIVMDVLLQRLKQWWWWIMSKGLNWAQNMYENHKLSIQQD